MKKFYTVLTLALLMFTSQVLLCAQIEAAAHKPLISGNFEQGQRIYENDEGSGDNYLFREGWLKWKQNLPSKTYYYVRIGYSENNFVLKDQYDSRTVDVTLNYTVQISAPLRLQTEINLRDKSYEFKTVNNYKEATADIELSLRPTKVDLISLGLKLQQEQYPENNKDNLLAGLDIDYEHKFWTGFSVHGGYQLTKENYFDPDLTFDKMRQSISVGFDYQL